MHSWCMNGILKQMGTLEIDMLRGKDPDAGKD